MRATFGNRGMALIGVIVLSALLMALAVALAAAVLSDTQLRGAYASGVTGFYAAESGLNKGMGEYRNIFLDYNVPHGTDFDPRTLTVGTRTVNYQMSQRFSVAPCDPGCSASGGCACQNITIPSGEVFSGLNATQYHYVVNSHATNTIGDTEASVGAEFLVGYIPLFQFVAFYKNDLEIAPGPEMHLQGRVHTNGDLYLDANDGPFYIEDNPAAQVYTVQVTSGKNIYRGRKRANNECTGTVVVDMLQDTSPKDGNLDPKTLSCNGSTATRLVPTSELATWKGSMIAGLGNISIPEPDIIEPPTTVSNGGSASPGVYWQKADLRLVLHLRAGNLCRSTMGEAANCLPTLPYQIEVVDASGNRDSGRTDSLYTFMRDAAWNNANSSFRGTMPILVTDVPFNTGSGCAQGTPGCNNVAFSSYGTSAATVIPAPGSPNPRANVGGAGAYSEIMGNALGTFDFDYRRGGFYNWREGKWMVLFDINVRDLILWNANQAGVLFTSTDGTNNDHGGIVIFATVDGPNSNTINNYGVRIFGSADLPVPPLPGGIGVSADPTGVTVVTDQALYVIGDFNRGPPGPARQPASLIGDSVNLMSNNYWKSSIAAVCGASCCTNQYCRDGQSVRNIGQSERNGATTTINAAFLGGVDTTPLNGGDATYNGGLENYPRFHEDWGSGPALNYQGSFVSLGTPAHVNGAWCGVGGPPCNIYNPPARNWNFDSAFNNAANLPPLTPRFVYVQQVLFTEDFK